ncbi:MAG: outer membrane protein [Marivirga sp.]|jgi:outer membrane protein
MRSKKLNIFTAFIVGLLLIPQITFAQKKDTVSFSQALSLEDCIQFGLENNQNLQAVRLNEQIAETQVGETRAQGLPQVSASAGVDNNYNIQEQLIDVSQFQQGAPSGTEAAVAFGRAYSANAAISVDQLIFDGSYFIGLKAAKTLRELRRKESGQSEIETVAAITTAFYLVLINEERVELVAENINQLKAILSDTKILYENGFVESIDVDRLQVNLNNLLTEKNKVERGVIYARNLLKFQMGMPVATPISLSGGLSQINFNAAEYLGQENEFNYSQRAEYNIIEVNEALTNLDLQNNKATHLPKINARFSYGSTTATDQFGQITDFSTRWYSFGILGANIQWNLFTGLRRSNLMERNKIQISQINLQKDNLENSIDLEISQNKADLRSAAESLEIQKKNIALAEKVYKQTQIKYNEGVGSSLEMLEAETSKKTAETNYYSALYDAIIAKINLEKALGILY